MLISIPGTTSSPSGISPERTKLANARERVVVRDREEAHAGRGGGRARALPGVRIPSERRVCVWKSAIEGVGGTIPPNGGWWRPFSAPGEPERRASPAHPSQTRWTRSIASARPVAGSMSIWVALKTTGPSATSNRVGSAVQEPRQHRRRVEPDDRPYAPPVHPRSLW